MAFRIKIEYVTKEGEERLRLDCQEQPRKGKRHASEVSGDGSLLCMAAMGKL